jgi:hypothetical protein
MAALESEVDIMSFLDTLDLSTYEGVYVSYGTYNDDVRSERNYQAKPVFLSTLKSCVCISIDPRFRSFEDYHVNTIRFINIPLLMPSDEEKVKEIQTTTKQNLYDIYRQYNLDKVIAITQKIVELLDKIAVKYVFFVNYIKYKNPRQDELAIEMSAREIKNHTGKYDYYDWCGYGLPTFIFKSGCSKHLTYESLKNRQVFSSYTNERLKSTDVEEVKIVFSRRPHEYDDFLKCVFDITKQIDINTLVSASDPTFSTELATDPKSASEPELAPIPGGKRKTKRKRKYKHSKRCK